MNIFKKLAISDQQVFPNVVSVVCSLPVVDMMAMNHPLAATWLLADTMVM